jgi:hypothetical protein
MTKGLTQGRRIAAISFSKRVVEDAEELVWERNVEHKDAPCPEDEDWL